MTLLINLPDDQAAALQAKADAAGLSLEDWLTKLAAETAAPANRKDTGLIVDLQQSNPQEWARQFRVWADGHNPNLPILSDNAMSRESIYADTA